jgi:hypothetical protein
MQRDLQTNLLRRFPDLIHAPSGFFVVGGAVRDVLLGLQPIDADLTGEGSVMAATVFANTTGGRLLELGRDPLHIHRIFVHGRIYDFADLFGGSIESDLARRDYTIDALAWRRDEDRLYDLHQGGEDLEAGIIRMIAERNLVDDPLRMLKAVRMAVRFDFRIEDATAEAIQRHAALITAVAPERVTYELNGCLTRRGLSLLHELELDQPIFGYPVEAVDAEHPDVALAAVIRDDNAARLGARWKWSRARIDTINALHRARRSEKPPEVLLHDTGPLLESYFRAIGDRRSELLGALDQSEVAGTRALLNGLEIARLAAIDAGAELGRIKRELLEAQLTGAVKTRQQAEAFVLARRNAFTE